MFGEASHAVWMDLIGQDAVAEQLKRAVLAAHALAESHHANDMTHAWLLTGPPGSGRATAARAFAAALACSSLGCGECQQCRLVLSGAHPDVDIVIPTAVTYRAEEIRGLVDQAQMMPTLSDWFVIIIEDADRLNETSANALLKALEEPTPHTVWMLCAPSAADVLPTIVSRARHLTLRSPGTDEVVSVLQQRHGVTREAAELAARASQGHIGRARALATDEQAQQRRRAVLEVAAALKSLPDCIATAKTLVETAQADADAICAPLNEADEQALAMAFGDGAEGKGIGTMSSRSRGEGTRIKRMQDSRARRIVRDQFDRVLLDLTGLYRDVLMVQTSSELPAINPDFTEAAQALARQSSVDATALRLTALRQASQRLRTNAAPLLVFEAALVSLWQPQAVASQIRDSVTA